MGLMGSKAVEMMWLILELQEVINRARIKLQFSSQHLITRLTSVVI